MCKIMEQLEGAAVNPLLDDTMMRNASDSFLLQIIEESQDINVVNAEGNTPLHLAVKRDSIKVAFELIKRGADINANGKKDLTPLHYAVDYSNIEAVCLLLYYNVDVTVVCRDNKVAFMDALDSERLEIAYLLLNYHEEFPLCSFRNYTVLHIFAQNVNPIAIDLVNMGVDYNSVNAAGYSGITYSLEYTTPDLFKLLWNRIDYKILFCTDVPFLLIYLDRCSFNVSDWVDCLYLILGSAIAFDVLQHSIDFVSEENETTFLEVLFTSIKKYNIELNDRVNIIYTVLTLGAGAYFSDIDWIVGTDSIEEALLLAYFSSNNLETISTSNVLTEFLSVTCNANSYNPQYIYDLFNKQILLNTCYCLMPSIIYALGYFSQPLCYKNQLVELISSTTDVTFSNLVAVKLAVVPEFPTLIEICRNRVRTIIQLRSKIKKPYDFYDILKKLPVPEDVKNQLSFKLPLYV